jgi:ABC-type Mn2+/Zn2+ transport system ATPase subunit
MRSDGSRDDVALLDITAARFGYAGSVVLEGVDLKVRRGEFWFVLGPNGSGKTTLLRAVLGLLPTQGGSVERHSEHAALSRIGFVPQRCAFSPALPTTVREFVSLGAIGSDRPSFAAGADLTWALDRARLGGMEDRDYWSLSGGQCQRALVARALVRRPSLLILDEPTEGMDLGSEAEFLETLDAMHRSGETTLLFVTHRVEIAARYATHVALVYEGGVKSGTRDDMLHSALVEETFGARVVVSGVAPASPGEGVPR